MTQDAGFIAPDWSLPTRVRALVTTRAGGVSLPPYASFNLGDHVGDDPSAVARNRARLRASLPAEPTWLAQVHGIVVADANEASGVPEADAVVARGAGAVCAVLTADCLPVLFCDDAGSVVAAAHAGWRGLAGQGGVGVLEAVFERFSALRHVYQAQSAIKNIANEGAGACASQTLAWLGPCIGPQAFEVGAEVRAAFCAHNPAAAPYFQPHGAGKYLADLAGLARQRLQALGITHIYGNDSSAAWCTVAQGSRFFSHRRDSAALGGSGRMAACIWLG